MAKRKNKKTEEEVVNEAEISVDSEDSSEKNEDIQGVPPLKKEAKLPKMEKGIPSGKLTFDIFFAYAIKKFPDQVKVNHYRAMRNYLKQKGHAMIDTKDGFCESFKAYGLVIE